MPRLIDADAAEKNWWQELRTNYADDYGKGFQAGLQAVIRQPTIAPAPQWIPVTERLPVESDADSKGRVFARLRGEETKIWHWSLVVDYSDNFTHWMPLPACPEDGGAEE